jgi:hypothetical protein
MLPDLLVPVIEQSASAVAAMRLAAAVTELVRIEMFPVYAKMQEFSMLLRTELC